MVCQVTSLFRKFALMEHVRGHNTGFSASEISSFLAYQVSISFHFSPNFPPLELLFGLDKIETNFKAHAIVDGNVSHGGQTA